MKFAAFDLEIAKSFPDGGHWQDAAPLGITCAALGLSDAPEPRYFQGAPQMTRSACAALVAALQAITAQGYTLVTWNGTGFDFPILAQESGLARECAELALAHVDLMLIVTFKLGHYLGLNKALQGAGISGKLQEVQLNDGSRLYEMGGKRAPELWAKGEYNAVLAYLRQDVMPLLQLTAHVARTQHLPWISRNGNLKILALEKLYTVRDCFAFPLPETAWMSDPPDREKFIEWMPPLDMVIPQSPYAPRAVKELPLFAYAAESEYWREFRRALAQHAQTLSAPRPTQI